MGTQTQLYTLSHEINAIVFESKCMFESSNVCRVKDTWFLSGTMINPEDIVAFLELETAKECETILGNPPELVPTTFFKVRDYILLSLIQTNAQRPGAVRSITPRVLQNTKVTEDGAVLTVGVNVISCLKIYYLKGAKID